MLGVEIVHIRAGKTLDDIFEMFWQTYEKSASKFEKLNRWFFEVIAEKQAAHFSILREKLADKMVAFMLCFDMGERLEDMYIGIDYSRPKEWMLFFRLWEVRLPVIIILTALAALRVLAEPPDNQIQTSPDGKWIVFVKPGHGPKIETAADYRGH